MTLPAPPHPPQPSGRGRAVERFRRRELPLPVALRPGTVSAASAIALFQAAVTLVLGGYLAAGAPGDDELPVGHGLAVAYGATLLLIAGCLAVGAVGALRSHAWAAILLLVVECVGVAFGLLALISGSAGGLLLLAFAGTATGLLLGREGRTFLSGR